MKCLLLALILLFLKAFAVEADILAFYLHLPDQKGSLLPASQLEALSRFPSLIWMRRRRY